MEYARNLKEAMNERGLGQKGTTAMAAPSPKRLIAQQIERAIAQQGLTRAEVAKRMGTSRAALARLLDGNNPAITLHTLEATCAALGLEVIITIQPKQNL